MFKVIREVPEGQQQHFYMICDCECGQIVNMAFDPNQPEQPQQVAFVQQAMKMGWKVALDKQHCPKHAATGTAVKQEQPMIVLANGRMPSFPLKVR